MKKDAKSNGESRSQLAYRTLRRLILDNELQMGTQHLERDLSERLGLSRTPVREACIQLEREGLIEIQPRHGIRVRPISPQDMREIYQVLTALESEAAATLARNGLTAKQLASLEASTAAMSQALEVADLEAWAEADEGFHYTLIDLCGNQRLKDAVLQLWSQAHRTRMFTLHLRETPYRSTEDHAAVVDAIRRGDVEGAAASHRDHRVRGGESLVALLEKYRYQHL